MITASESAIRVVDSHTAGEPTRIVVDGLPRLAAEGPLAARQLLAESADWLRTSLVTEPRGAAWMVGAVLLPPTSPAAAAGVVFFNNAGYLGMCGHGLIGLVATLAYLERIGPGTHCFETPVGTVTAHLLEGGDVAIDNVPSYRHLHGIRLKVRGYPDVVGDVAWGGNWFFLAKTDQPLLLEATEELILFTQAIRDALAAQGVTGAANAEIDHIELFGPPSDAATADARNFVLCPGGQYDRSPCGTGTSAKVACLAAEGRLEPGRVWRQQSITGGVFAASYRLDQGEVLPTITGRAHVNGDWRLVVDPSDPFRFGMISGGPEAPAAEISL